MLEIRGIWLCHMSRWDRYVLRPRVREETSGSEIVPHIGPYSYRQGEPSPYLVSRLLRRARLSYNRVSLDHEQVSGPPHTGGIHLNCRSDTIHCAGTVGSPDSLPLRIPVYQYPRPAIQSQP